MDSFTHLKVWQEGLALVRDIYRISRTFPKEEQYGLTSQLRRAAVSILANLAEGFGRYTYADKANKYTIARGECTEVEAIIYICGSLELISKEIQDAFIIRIKNVGRMLSGLIQSTKSQSKS